MNMQTNTSLRGDEGTDLSRISRSMCVLMYSACWHRMCDLESHVCPEECDEYEQLWQLILVLEDYCSFSTSELELMRSVSA